VKSNARVKRLQRSIVPELVLLHLLLNNLSKLLKLLDSTLYLLISGYSMGGTEITHFIKSPFLFFVVDDAVV